MLNYLDSDGIAWTNVKFFKKDELEANFEELKNELNCEFPYFYVYGQEHKIACIKSVIQLRKYYHKLSDEEKKDLFARVGELDKYQYYDNKETSCKEEGENQSVQDENIGFSSDLKEEIEIQKEQKKNDKFPQTEQQERKIDNVSVLDDQSMSMQSNSNEYLVEDKEFKSKKSSIHKEPQITKPQPYNVNKESNKKNTDDNNNNMVRVIIYEYSNAELFKNFDMAFHKKAFSTYTNTNNQEIEKESNLPEPSNNDSVIAENSKNLRKVVANYYYDCQNPNRCNQIRESKQ